MDSDRDTLSAEKEATRRLWRDEDAHTALAHTVTLSSIVGEEFDGVYYLGGDGLQRDQAEDKKSIALNQSILAACNPVAACAAASPDSFLCRFPRSRETRPSSSAAGTHRTSSVDASNWGFGSGDCLFLQERFCPTLFAMDNERIREICLALPNVTETLNWGHHLVYWVGDRDIGGKMFAMTDLDGTGVGVLWFHCGAERFHELLEIEGISGAPHLARAFWVAIDRWDALRPRQIEDELCRAHALIYEKLPKRTKNTLALPAKERARLIRERSELLAARANLKRA